MLDKAHLGDVGFRDIPMYGPQKARRPIVTLAEEVRTAKSCGVTCCSDIRQ